MNKQQLSLIIIFLFFGTLLSDPKTKEFKNIVVQNLMRDKILMVDENAYIGGSLIVAGDLISPSTNSNVNGPTSSVPNSIALFADATGKVLKDSSVTVDSSGNIEIEGITKNGNTVSWPSTIGGSGTFLGSDGAGNLIFATPAGGGNVTTDNAFTTDNAIVRVDLSSGSNNIQESNIILDDSDNITGINQLTANTVNASLNGNATTATTATNFSGSLSGDVSGTQTATVVDTVGGQTAANIASATIAANSATSANTANTIVRRDASGNFSAGTITAALNGNATTATTSTNFSGSLAGDVSGTQTATVVDTVGGQTAANIASATIAANSATSANTANTIVLRDASGNFSAGTITASLDGNATTATNFTGSLSGDVVGTQNATLVEQVGGQSAANIAAATIAANSATSANTANTIVLRDAAGKFSAGTITASLDGNATTATNFTGSLSGDVVGTQNATLVEQVGGQSAANIAAATIAANAATSANTANTIVRRDASGNFSAGTITASLIGAASLNVLKSGDTMTGTLTLPPGDETAPTLNFTGSTGTGLSAPLIDVLYIHTGSNPRMIISELAISALLPFLFLNVQCDLARQSVTPTDGGSVTVANTTSILFLTHTANVTNFTIVFPSTGLNNGHMFTVMLATTNTITLINDGAGATIVNEITALDPTVFAGNTGGTAVTYIYDQDNNTWFRLRRG